MQRSFLATPQQGYFLQPYQAHPPGAPGHFLGDDTRQVTACPQCGDTLTTLLKFDTTDHRLEIPKTRSNQLPLLICPGCRISDYTQTSAGEILALPAAHQHPLWTGRLRAPSPVVPVVMHAIPDRITEARSLAAEGRIEEAAEWAKKFDWQTPGNQIGGIPPIPRSKIPNAVCPLCSAELPFLACVACPVVDISSNEIGDATVIVFHFCRKCVTVVGAIASAG